LKIYLTWRLNPQDPPYWKYMEVDGILISLGNIMNSKRHMDHLISKGFKTCFNYRGKLIVDSLISSLWSHENKAIPINVIFNIQVGLGADYIIQKDHPLVNKQLSQEAKQKILQRNLDLAEVYLKLADKLGVEVITVAHGWNVESYTYSARKLAEMGSNYIAIGSLVPLIKEGKLNQIKKIVKSIRHEIGRKTKLHLLGVLSPSMLNYLKNIVDSLDTSSHIRAAYLREIYYLTKDNIRRCKISKLGYHKLLKISLGDPILERAINEILSAKDFSKMKYWLSIYNARVLMKYR